MRPHRLLAGIFLVSACHDPLSTTPDSGVTSAATRTLPSAKHPTDTDADRLDSRLPEVVGACIVAVRGTSGLYTSRSVRVDVPAHLAEGKNDKMIFGYRGWALGVPEPAVIAVCRMPATAAARAYFDRRFNARAMTPGQLRAFAAVIGVASEDGWDVGSPHVIQGMPRSYVIDGWASSETESETDVSITSGDLPIEGCDPQDPTPEPGCETEQETFSETPPDLGQVAEVVELNDATASTTSPPVCRAQTDLAHRSTTAGFEGRLNVKARTECNASGSLFTVVALKRQRCVLWIFCTWPTVATGSKSATSNQLLAMANTDCAWQKGWYVGVADHYAVIANWNGYARSMSPYAVKIQCW